LRQGLPAAGGLSDACTTVFITTALWDPETYAPAPLQLTALPIAPVTPNSP
jgi:hypothetical protein